MSKWRPHTTGVLVSGLVLILIALVASYMATNFQPKTEVRLGSGVFNVRLADTEPARVQGLSGTAKLGAHEGLLMVFEADAPHGIWMKDMNIPLILYG